MPWRYRGSQSDRARSQASNRRYGREHAARRKIVLVRDGYLCQLHYEGCWITANCADHIVSLAEGGDDSLENLQAACSHCNSVKAAREHNARRKAEKAARKEAMRREVAEWEAGGPPPEGSILPAHTNRARRPARKSTITYPTGALTQPRDP